MARIKQAMLSKLNYLKFILSIFCLSSFLSLAAIVKGQQNAMSGFNQADAKAEEVLNLARQAINKQVNTNDIKSLFAAFSGDYQPTEKESSLEKKVSYSFESKWEVEIPDKLHIKEAVNYTSNQESKEITINKEAVASSSQVTLNGQTIGISISPQNQQKLNVENKIKYKTNAFVNFFPLLLSWNANTEFKFIGTAETKDGQASVLETIMPDTSRWQLFFDRKNNLLLLMIQTFVDEKTNEKKELRYFLSDYKEDGGLFIPHKITSKLNGEVVQEQTLKTLKINPTFKAGNFEVK